MQKSGESTGDEIRKLVSENRDLIEALRNLNRKLDPALEIKEAVTGPVANYMNDPVDESKKIGDSQSIPRSVKKIKT